MTRKERHFQLYVAAVGRPGITTPTQARKHADMYLEAWEEQERLSAPPVPSEPAPVAKPKRKRRPKKAAKKGESSL